jgi:hypothetical protein
MFFYQSVQKNLTVKNCRNQTKILNCTAINQILNYPCNRKNLAGHQKYNNESFVDNFPVKISLNASLVFPIQRGKKFSQLARGPL